ncbi:unnamed protein product [Adineta steineri]|uniref:NHL repeat containing protein-like protein n=1 Tax=Adineta steineri TaxID=433720 RepID=A0A819JMJ4_9BILA|nr:unnamed protein product [Adineta steineri]
MNFPKKKHKLTISFRLQFSSNILSIFLVLALSFNQPKFCPTAMWDSNGITFANQSIVGEWPSAIFMSINNTIYVHNKENNTIVMWQEESVNPTKIIHGNFTEPISLFVTPNGDIYIDDGEKNGQAQKWIAETNIFVTVMHVNSSCFGLFVDINNTLYCSMFRHHQVVKRSLDDSVMTSNRVAAGTGIRGSDSNQFYNPRGIFVDVNLDLYVADCYNDRVQLFQSGELNGITVAGRRSLPHTMELNHPTGIILDAEKYLFIVDQNNHRIVASGLNGFRCLVGCYGRGSQSNQLTYPSSLSFDRFGNMFVTDQNNHRIQIFQYLEESCDNSSVVKTVYSSALTSSSSIYFQDCSELPSYYEAIQIHVTITGLYTFLVSGEMKTTYSYIHTNSFNVFNWFENVLTHNEDNDDRDQYQLTVVLEATMKYVFVMTTSSPNITGNVSIQVSGRSSIGFNRILNTSSVVQTTYASKLTANSSTYVAGCTSQSSYYEAIQVNVRRSGTYTFFSQGNMDTSGAIYKDYFNPSNPGENRLSSNNVGCNQRQFRFTIALESSITYILVVTTWSSNVIGAFSIFVSGPDNVDLKNIRLLSKNRIKSELLVLELVNYLPIKQD